MMTAYYSHPLVEGLFVWTYMRPELYSLCYPDGTIKLNGLVWYYMHRMRYNTESSQNTDTNGTVSLNAYKGLYDITVKVDGKTYETSITLDENETVSVPVSTDGVSAYWGPWPIDDNYWVDTGDWMGWLQVEDAPWIWSQDLAQWLYFPYETTLAGTGWCWINNS
jgi:hypothetical protein